MECLIQYRVQGWGISLLLHAALVSMVLMAVANVDFNPKQEVFRWEVSVVQTPTQQTPSDSASEPQTTPAPRPPARTKSSPPVDAPKPSVTRRLETKEVTESVRPQSSPPKPLERQVVERKPVEQAHPIKQADPTPIETAIPRPIETPETHERQHVVQERKAIEDKAAPLPAHTLQEVAAVQRQEPVVSSAPPQEATPITKEVAAKEVATFESSTPVQKKIIEAQEAAPISNTPPPMTQTAEAVESPSPVTRDITPIPQERHPAESRPPMVAHADSPPAQTSSSPPVQSTPKESPDLRDTVAPAQNQAAEAARGKPPVGALAKAYPTPRADFGWLTQALWRKIEQLKRYPHKARMNRWEGTVVVRCVIRHDGYFAELTMEKSSGHDVLDEDAIELLRKASPLSLKHELGRPELTIRIPISYKLE